MNSSQFYEETVEFVEDVEDYYAISSKSQILRLPLNLTPLL